MVHLRNFLIFSVIFLFSCNPAKPTITELNVIHPGIGVDSIYLGETQINKIENIKTLNSKGISFQTNEGKEITIITLKNNLKYNTNKGIKIGKFKNDIINAFGEPTSVNINLKKSETIIGTIKTLNYNGIRFLFLDNDSVVSHIHVFKNVP